MKLQDSLKKLADQFGWFALAQAAVQAWGEADPAGAMVLAPSQDQMRAAVPKVETADGMVRLSVSTAPPLVLSPMEARSGGIQLLLAAEAAQTEAIVKDYFAKGRDQEMAAKIQAGVLTKLSEGRADAQRRWLRSALEKVRPADSDKPAV